MNFLKTFYKKTLKYDLVNKFNYTKIKQLPKLKKIILNFGCKNNDMKNLSSCILALQLITAQKGYLTTTKRSNILLKIRKGQPVGCKVVLRKQNMLLFFSKMISDIFPKLKNFDGFKINRKTKLNSFSFSIIDMLIYNELEERYYIFNSLPKLTITLITDAKLRKELIFILNALQLILKT